MRLYGIFGRFRVYSYEVSVNHYLIALIDRRANMEM